MLVLLVLLVLLILYMMPSWLPGGTKHQIGKGCTVHLDGNVCMIPNTRYVRGVQLGTFKRECMYDTKHQIGKGCTVRLDGNVCMIPNTR